METLDAIYKRRSIRKFLDTPVEKEKLECLLKAGFSAPSAVNAQPWEFVVITEQETLEELKKHLIFARYNAQAAILVCGNMKLSLKGADKEQWVQDCSAAMENILLAGTDIGLGTVWIGIYPVDTRIKHLRKILNIPDYVVPFGMAYIGYPAQELEGRSQYNEKRVYWEMYDRERKHRTKDKPIHS